MAFHLYIHETRKKDLLKNKAILVEKDSSADIKNQGLLEKE